jgi:predicted RNA-binding protein with RPS1 domain
MVESALPIITSFEEAAVGTLAHGTVSRIWPDRGVFVEFYGGIGGFVPLKELSVVPVRSAAVACTDGQVVRCRVLSQRHADKRLLLTLLTLDESHSTRTSASGLAAASALDVRAGSFVDGVVTQVAPNFVYVRLALERQSDAESSVVGVLQLAHTADVTEAQRLPAMGARLTGLLVLRIDSARVVLSQKPLLVVPPCAPTRCRPRRRRCKVGTVLRGS